MWCQAERELCPGQAEGDRGGLGVLGCLSRFWGACACPQQGLCLPGWGQKFAPKTKMGFSEGLGRAPKHFWPYAILSGGRSDVAAFQWWLPSGSLNFSQESPPYLVENPNPIGLGGLLGFQPSPPVTWNNRWVHPGLVRPSGWCGSMVWPHTIDKI